MGPVSRISASRASRSTKTRHVRVFFHLPEPSLDELREMFTSNYHKVFGRFRRRGDPEVPSDSLKKNILVERLVGLIDQRRREYAVERAYIATQRRRRLKHEHIN
jgi:hypothetical protein